MEEAFQAGDDAAVPLTDEQVYGRYPRDRFGPVASWALYDFANTIYSAIVVTFYLSLYVTKELGSPNALLGAATFASMLFSALISPFLGALPDRTGRTKAYLVVATVLCCACTALLSLSPALAVVIAAYFVANVCYQVAMVFYNSLLPVVASPRRQGMVSGVGVALGYIGVILALAVAHLLFVSTVSEGPGASAFRDWQIEGLTENVSNRGTVRVDFSPRPDGGAALRVYRLDGDGGEIVTARGEAPPRSLPGPLRFEPVGGSGLGGTVYVEDPSRPVRGLRVWVSYRYTFLSAGALFLLFALPLFLWVPERAVRNPRPFTFSIFWPSTRAVLRNILGLLRAAWTSTRRRGAPPSRVVWRRRNIFFFLLGNFLCVDVLNTAIQWFSKYMDKVFAFTSNEILLFGVGMSASAFAGGLVMGKLTGWIGARRAVLLAACLLLLTLVITGLFASPVVVVSAIMVAGACGLAGLWVAGRKLLIELAPPEMIGEYFGLYGITIKISVVGTLLFSLITDWGEAVGTLLHDLACLLPGGADMHWNYRLAILAQLLMLVPGILFLRAVRTEEEPRA